MKFLRIEKSLTSAENVVLTIVNRREGATLFNCNECHSIEVRRSDLLSVADFVDELDEPAVEVTLGTLQGL